MKTMFMHTLDGKPADYDGDQICFAKPRTPLGLCNSMDEIREQRKKSSAWRKRQGWKIFHDYGFQKVQIHP